MNYKEQLQRLNEYQKAAVFDESNACLVNANVGSGKTTVLITKVMYLHCERQIPYRQMVVLTFTNKAAACLRAGYPGGRAVGIRDVPQCEP